MPDVTLYPYEPDYAVPPGWTLEETIENLEIDQRGLAELCDLSETHVLLIIKGIAPITPEIALKLGDVTGVPARLWTALEDNYRRRKASLECGPDLR